jgi:phage tail-like protein
MTSALRAFALVRTQDQWSRMAHENTFIDGETQGVELSWDRPLSQHASAPLAPLAGLAFDAECRMYRTLPDDGRVVRLHWTDAVATPAPPAPDVVDPGVEPALGDFKSTARGASSLRRPVSLAIDVDDRLFVADADAAAIFVFDLWSGRLLRRVRIGTGAALCRRPLGLACHERTVWAVTADPGALIHLTARTGPRDAALPVAAGVPADARPSRLTVDRSGAVCVLLRRPDGAAWVVLAGQPNAQLVQGATDLAFDGQGSLVVACQPGEPFRVFTLGPEGWTEVGPLESAGYDGSGIALTPSGRIGYWTAGGLRMALTARRSFSRQGRVTTYRLDSGAFQTAWGRLFLDACIPATTEVRVHCATSDEEDDGPGIPRTPPGNLTAQIPRPDLSPPMPPAWLAPPDGELSHRLHRRETGRELPWARPSADDPFETYEAPVIAPPGRYLWVTLQLLGDTKHTPRIRCLRAEHPGHDLLRRLPRTYSREAATAAFLARYLSPLEGVVNDLDARAELRNALVNPDGAPEEVLPWLASFLGLLLDLRWPVAARRQLVREVTWLFRFRGTLPGLRRFIEIYLGFAGGAGPGCGDARGDLTPRVIILEKFRLRGLGGAILGATTGAAFSSSILGAGFRVGGAIDSATGTALQGTAEDAFKTHAHRFSVLIPSVLTAEQEAVVAEILRVHRPAHTVFEICPIGVGMQLGRGLHIGLSSIVGRTAGFTSLQLGTWRLGRDEIVGRAEPGIRPGSSRLGSNSRVG